MFRFKNQQFEFTISGVRFGGQPGRRRTVMVGSMCYPRHTIIEDRTTGRCHAGSFERLLALKSAAMEETSTPGGVMLFAETAEAMEMHLRRAADITSMPLFIDSPSVDVRLGGRGSRTRSASRSGSSITPSPLAFPRGSLKPSVTLASPPPSSWRSTPPIWG